MFMKWLTADSSPKSAQRRRSNWRKGTLLVISITMLLTTACSILPKEEEEEVLPPITPPTISKKPEYEVTKATLETKVSANGKLMSQQEENLYFTLDGKRIKDVLVKNGDSVKAGQTLAMLDVEDMQKDLRSKRLQLRKEEMQMKETLRNKDEMDPIQFEEAQILFEERRQEIADLENDIAKAELKAPYAGTLVSLNMKKGDATKSYETVAIVADTSRLAIAVQLSKEDLKRIALDMETVVSINNVDKKLKGKVKSLPNPSTDNNNNNGQQGQGNQQDRIDQYVLIQVDQLPEGLKRGTPLNAQIIIQRKKDAVVIPTAALRTLGLRTYVQVVDENGKREVDVEVGQQTPTQVEILHGLEVGQKVVGR
ncbi:efflux RND transporter periplasmic adaptor subunit [Paenibacillus aquistagni]|uniref:Membrane fusion protein, macrolide-specific efflux system n=1 Tax=Paenibacillus aquistagni TaxID=1852522 RepID=A0A1X7IHD7_9BACL|nr:efflux RND transporter periplasmic adaptor subunit [Paenibacillus aquistagni]SMG13838.1 membrane fusion protein, macrolide-specific efflux system [Paenibacillus aquistagni]